MLNGEEGFELADAGIVVRDIEDYKLAGGIIYGAQNVVEIACRTVLWAARFRTPAGGRPRLRRSGSRPTETRCPDDVLWEAVGDER